MRHGLLGCLMILAFSGSARAHGLLIPEDKSLPPLALVNHRVTIAIEDARGRILRHLASGVLGPTAPPPSGHIRFHRSGRAP